jgi:hypothetical protein
MCKKFDLRRDDCHLKHFFGLITLNEMQTRCLEFLSERDFEIKHIKRKENQVANALRRRDHEVNISAISMYRTNFEEKIVATTNSDQLYLKIK